MLMFLLSSVLAIVVGVLFLINISLFAFLVILFGLFEMITPFHSGRQLFNKLINGAIPSMWMDINSFILSLPYNIQWEIHGHGDLKPDHWYFLIANHRSWVDILVLQKVFNRKIPILKFFMKQELLWSLPVGGLACWMLDFPFLKRYNKAQLKKNPALREKDIETTKLACNHFKHRPTTVMNFLEGTRYTKQKQKDRSSSYQHLLRPKAGGVAFVVNELRDYIHEIIDTTIIYHHEEPTFWNLLCGRIHKITVYYEVIPLRPDQYGEYYGNVVFRKQFQAWINERWRQKDQLISQHLTEA
jgi:1-acyl-sn-glycerol-3-phosphate acyltransferase